MNVKFKCPYNEECKNCCVFKKEEEMPIVFIEEKERLERLGVKEFKLIKVGRLRLYRWIIKGRCPFNDPETGLCKIHAVKPLACKMFPLLLNPVTGEVSISQACSWVRAHLEEIKDKDPREVFPKEWEAVLKAFARVKLRG